MQVSLKGKVYEVIDCRDNPDWGEVFPYELKGRSGHRFALHRLKDGRLQMLNLRSEYIVYHPIYFTDKDGDLCQTK